MPFIYVPLNVIGFVLFYIASVAAFGAEMQLHRCKSLDCIISSVGKVTLEINKVTGYKLPFLKCNK